MNVVDQKKVNELVAKIQLNPNNYKVLERIPLTTIDENASFPILLSTVSDDSIPMIILDFETTGLSFINDKVIELAMLKVSYSPKQQKIVEINGIFDKYEDPGIKISPKITELTGITDDMVRGQYITTQEVASFINGCDNANQSFPVIVSHNAAFDRKFFERRFPQLTNYPWACSIKDVNWDKYGFNSYKQEFIAYKLGYFYEAHRAIVDCQALAFILNQLPDALADLYHNVFENTYVIALTGNTYDIKDKLKQMRFIWSQANRYWVKVNVREQEKDELINALERLGLTPSNINIQYENAMSRYGENSIANY